MTAEIWCLWLRIRPETSPWKGVLGDGSRKKRDMRGDHDSIRMKPWHGCTSVSFRKQAHTPRPSSIGHQYKPIEKLPISLLISNLHPETHPESDFVLA